MASTLSLDSRSREENHRPRMQEISQIYIDKRYHETITYINAISRPNFQHQRVGLLYLRARAYAMTGQYEKAKSDAQELILQSPFIGHVLLGEIHTIYGYHGKAFQAYSVARQHDSDNEVAILKIMYAMKSQQKTVDIIKRLDEHDHQQYFGVYSPTQLADKIIMLLPSKTIAFAMEVSRSWRTRVLECTEIWTNMQITQDHHPRYSHLLPSMFHQIKALTMDTPNFFFRGMLFNRMCRLENNGIESLSMTAKGVFNLLLFVPRLTLAFSKCKSLTNINLCFNSVAVVLSLTDVLEACPHLTSLTYTTKHSLDPESLELCDTSTFDLTRLKLRAKKLSGKLLIYLLKSSPNLQYLEVDGCDTTFFKYIPHFAPKLQVLGYNMCDRPIPHHEMVQEQGLRIFYTRVTKGPGMLAMVALPFLYEHMATLEKISIHVGNMAEEQSKYFANALLKFKLGKLRSLEISAKKRTQQCIFSSIHHSQLNRFSITHVFDTSAMVKALDTVSLTHLSIGKMRYSNTNIKHLLSLCTTYADKPLESVSFSGCPCITDDVLAKLANITAIRHVAFEKLDRVTSKGLDGFFDAAKNLKSVKLASMSTVTDHTLAIIGGCKRLYRIDLDFLSGVTDGGIADFEKANIAVLVKKLHSPLSEALYF